MPRHDLYSRWRREGDVNDFVFVRLKFVDERSKREVWDLDGWEGVAEDGEGWKMAWRIWLKRRERDRSHRKIGIGK
jgi:hypothetical protein